MEPRITENHSQAVGLGPNQETGDLSPDHLSSQPPSRSPPFGMGVTIAVTLCLSHVEYRKLIIHLLSS